MRRWSLPLLLTALLVASGCVTVHPTPGPAATASPATVATDHKHPARSGQRAAEPALPLSPLPGAQPSAEPRTEPAPHAPSAAQSRQSAAIPRRHRPARPHQATAPHRPAPPKRAAKARTTGTAKAKPAARTPAPRRPGRPAPGVRAGDMAALCRSVHGVTSPTITALCHQTYR